MIASAQMRAILWFSAMTGSYAALAACVRELSGDLPPMELVMARSIIGMALLAPWAIRTGRDAVLPVGVRIVFVRSILGFAGMYLLFLGLAGIPISDAAAIQFMSPIFIVIGAALFLGEKVGPRRWAATAVGFVGMLIIFRPGIATISTPALYVLGAAMAFGVVGVVTKFASARVAPGVVVLNLHLVTLVLAIVPLTAIFVMPQWHHVPWLLGIGVFGSTAPMAMTRAYKLADASFLAPFKFTELLWAAMFGWLIFNELSDAYTWYGGTLIFLATAYIARREMMLARSKEATPGGG